MCIGVGELGGMYVSELAHLTICAFFFVRACEIKGERRRILVSCDMTELGPVRLTDWAVVLSRLSLFDYYLCPTCTLHAVLCVCVCVCVQSAPSSLPTTQYHREKTRGKKRSTGSEA